MGLGQGIFLGTLFLGFLFLPGCLTHLWRWPKASGIFDMDQM